MSGPGSEFEMRQGGADCSWISHAWCIDCNVQSTRGPLSWPSCPPGRSPLGSRRGHLPTAWGEWLDGSRDEVRESCCTCSRNCWTVASKCRTMAFKRCTVPSSATMRASSARMYACASNGVRSHTSRPFTSEETYTDVPNDERSQKTCPTVAPRVAYRVEFMPSGC
jgi:hypothetical protein